MLARKVERRLLFASTLEVCTGGEEQGEAVGVASECTDAERCVLVAYAPHVDGRACLQQQLHTRRAALDAAREQRRRAARARARAGSALALSRSRVHSTSPFEALTKSSDVSPLAALTSACASTSMSAHLTCPFAIATKSGVAPSWVVHQRTSAPDHKSSFTQSRWPF